MTIKQLLNRLAGTPLGARVKLGVPMSAYTSFRVGGPADALVEAESPDDIALLVQAAVASGMPYTVIGLGTNLLVLDGGIRGLVIRVGPGLSDTVWDCSPHTAVAGAGVPLAGLSRAAAQRGLTGLEFAEGIPGTVGGAVVMNAGAYGGEIGQIVDWVEALDLAALDGAHSHVGAAVVRLAREELAFGYRHSVIQSRPLAVTRVQLRLTPGDAAEISHAMSDFASRRRSRQPLEHPSAGSFFKRPAGRYVGPMIEACSLKGFGIGGAEVSVKHANFIVNSGGATAADILAVAAHVRRSVLDRFGVELEPEVRIIGEPAAGGADGSLRGC